MDRWWQIIKAIFTGNFIGVFHIVNCVECRSWLWRGSNRCFQKDLFPKILDSKEK
jgi:hypothetical protein